MNLLQKLRARFKPQPQPLLKDTQLADIAKAIQAPVAPPPRKSRGRIIKRAQRPEFDPRTTRHGGRIVKVMPRELQKIKEAQEKVDD